MQLSHSVWDIFLSDIFRAHKSNEFGCHLVMRRLNNTKLFIPTSHAKNT